MSQLSGGAPGPDPEQLKYHIHRLTTSDEHSVQDRALDAISSMSYYVTGQDMEDLIKVLTEVESDLNKAQDIRNRCSKLIVQCEKDQAYGFDDMDDDELFSSPKPEDIIRFFKYMLERGKHGLSNQELAALSVIIKNAPSPSEHVIQQFQSGAKVVTLGVEDEPSSRVMNKICNLIREVSLNTGIDTLVTTTLSHEYAMNFDAFQELAKDLRIIKLNSTPEHLHGELQDDHVTAPLREFMAKYPGKRFLVLGGIDDCCNYETALPYIAANEYYTDQINAIYLPDMSSVVDPAVSAIMETKGNASKITDFAFDIAGSPIEHLQWEGDFVGSLPLGESWNSIICLIDRDDNPEKLEEPVDPNVDLVPDDLITA